VKIARYLTITCLLMCAVSGCSRGGKIELGDTNSEGFKDGQYYKSVRGMAAPAQFKAFQRRPSRRFQARRRTILLKEQTSTK
jgi:hypothetical protein